MKLIQTIREVVAICGALALFLIFSVLSTLMNIGEQRERIKRYEDDNKGNDKKNEDK